ncbi:MAG: hypothetical protein ACXIUV_08420 [Alkalilacustris sp.]
MQPEPLHRLADAAEGIATALEVMNASDTAPEPLVAALAATFGRDAFLSGEAWTAAQHATEAAQAAGLRVPDLPHELQRAGIEGPHALGRWLAQREERPARAGCAPACGPHLAQGAGRDR